MFTCVLERVSRVLMDTVLEAGPMASLFHSCAAVCCAAHYSCFTWMRLWSAPSVLVSCHANKPTEGVRKQKYNKATSNKRVTMYSWELFHSFSLRNNVNEGMFISVTHMA